jgi:type IV secretion system protein VirD4
MNLFQPRPPTTFGSASWASLARLRREGLVETLRHKPKGPVLGCLTPAEIGGADTIPLHGPEEGHLFTAATTGSGKTSGQMITALHHWPHSALVTDLDGANYAATAGWLRGQGHEVYRFKPFSDESLRWNPIEAVNEGAGDGPDDPIRQANIQLLANLCVPPNPMASEPYWHSATVARLAGFCLYVATAPLAPRSNKDPWSVRERTMAQVRELIMLPPEHMAELVNRMARSEERWVRDCANTILQMSPAREQSASVQTLLMQNTEIWANSRIQKATRKSDFSFADLRKSGKDAKPVTVYWDIPFKDLPSARQLLRVMTGFAMKSLEETWRPGVPPVLMLLDEFPQLAYMEPIENAILYMRHFAVKFWFFVQDLSQLKRHYRDTWQQFLANSAVCTFSGVNDMETAKLVSEMTGQATIANRSFQTGVSETYGESESNASSSGSSAQGANSGHTRTFTTSMTRGTSFNSTLGYVARPLCTPDEVMRMPFGASLTFIKGVPAIRSQLAFWFEHTRERGLIPPPN